MHTIRVSSPELYSATANWLLGTNQVEGALQESVGVCVCVGGTWYCTMSCTSISAWMSSMSGRCLVKYWHHLSLQSLICTAILTVQKRFYSPAGVIMATEPCLTNLCHTAEQINFWSDTCHHIKKILRNKHLPAPASRVPQSTTDLTPTNGLTPHVIYIQHTPQSITGSPAVALGQSAPGRTSLSPWQQRDASP